MNCEAECDNTPDPDPPANQAPTLNPGLSDQTINAGSSSTYILPECSDPEGAPCTFQADITPPFVSFDPGSRTYFFNPSSTVEGAYDVTF